ncbi:MAG TPA: protein kinase, partial [Candidatus Angelobacter sp.]|nr:protein kinase [Candidatus Angelobacter sp.]
MNPERWREIERVLNAALDLEPTQRAAFLREACTGDESLRYEVDSLLAFEKQAERFIQTPYHLAPELIVREGVRPEERALFKLGRKLGRYKILMLLGKGGMGEVYLAYDPRLGRKLALKFLPQEFTYDRERVQRFEQEARAASALNHPNIITIFEIDQIDDIHFIAAEFIEGQTLRQRLEGGAMELSEALAIAVQIASALVEAHDAGIVHRDIKPENIMLRPDALVKVLDFGLAKLTERHVAAVDTQGQTVERNTTEPALVEGTVSYMSPEHARGLKVDHRTDIYSLGVVVYEMITGNLPFEGETASDVIASILKNEPLPLTNLWLEAPLELQRIVTRALRKDREERYQDVKNLLLDLKSFREESNSGSALATMNRKMKLPWLLRSRRRGIMLSLAAFVILLVTAGGLLWWYFRPQGAPPIGRALPLTSYPGFELNPAVSHDGNQVAFTWDGEAQDNFDIYIKSIGSSSHRRLTTNMAEDFSPAWSPNGRTIAFLRRLDNGRNELLLIPALGGPERKLAETFSVDYTGPRLPSLAWSPDGDWLAVSHRDSEDIAEGLFLVSTLTGEKLRLTQPLSQRGDFKPSFSPDGRTLFFSRYMGYSTMAVYSLDLSRDFKPAGEARRITTGELWASNPVWTRDGHKVLYLTSTQIDPREQTELRVIDVSNTGRSDRVTILQGNINEVSLGRHLVYTQSYTENDIWRAEIPS